MSRRAYLEKREKSKLAEIEDDLKDEEFLWGDVELTEAERADIELKKKLFGLAKARMMQSCASVVLPRRSTPNP